MQELRGRQGDERGATNLTVAAERKLHTSQPSLSAIRIAELSLGIVLFPRDDAGVDNPQQQHDEPDGPKAAAATLVHGEVRSTTWIEGPSHGGWIVLMELRLFQIGN